MDIVDESTLDSLVDWDGPPCVSLYMPTHRIGREAEADPILLKNLLDEAEHRLIEYGLRPRAADDVLEEGRRLQTDAVFWAHQEAGLAVFAAPKRTRWFRVPEPFRQVVVVGDTFHVKPLFPAASRGERFSVLALSENHIRLFSATRYRVGEVELPAGTPRSLEEALQFEDPEKQLQSHVGGRTGRGGVVVTFHGSPDVREDEDSLRFFRAVDDGVLHVVARDDPLVLAGVEETVALYRKVTGHPTVLSEIVAGNADRATPGELHARAWEIAEPHFVRVVGDDERAFLAAGPKAVPAVTAAVTAALEGRVAAIFVPASTQAWGTTGAAGEVTLHEHREAGDHDLFDTAAVAVWRAGGRVHVTDDIPGDGPVAALLRY